MTLRTDWSERSCPVARSLDVVGDPWILLILRDSMLGSRRYEQFRSHLHIADNVLSRRLAAMVQDGLLRRVPYRAGNRTQDEYRVTAKGLDLMPVLNALAQWGDRHTAGRRTDGHVQIFHLEHRTETADVCSECGQKLTPGEVSWHREWMTERPTPIVTR